MLAYDHHAVEAKWREAWEKRRIWEVNLYAAQHPYYNLMMFPYPSAEGLHVGNVFAFAGADIHGRFMAMRGYDVFEPIGFDAFGIHSENYALKINEHPARLIERNTRRFTEQLQRMGGRFDWSHAVYTTDPTYYKWTQWIFLQLYKGGLAYQDRAPVNWCPSCKTVLADEQVVDGRCERCGTPVTQRELTQWFLRITRYAGQLLDQLDDLDWSEVVKTAQRNWIGRSTGVEIRFPVEGFEGETIDCFTTRPDTIFGVTCLALAPEHPMVGRLTTLEQRPEVEAYATQAAGRVAADRLSGDLEKTGVFTGSHVVNPLSGERLPVWVADYVLAGYGSGAVMVVPAHDERDFAFAHAMGLPVRVVVVPPGWSGSRQMAEAYTAPGRLVNSGDFSGLDSAKAWRLIADWIEEKVFGERTVTYRLRDWLISRQRYWGPPIPIIHCDTCGTVPVPEEDLPVLLPEVEDFKPLGTGQSPLAAAPEWVRVPCPRCGREARRETDVSDNFLDSSWYFLRYPSAHDVSRAWDPGLIRKWLPVDSYIGGKEHAVLHLMYTRFITFALHDLGWLSFDTPFRRFRAHGVITREGAKMSKSRGNVVNPDEYFNRYGADTFRTYLMFMGSYEEGGDFSDAGIRGVRRFLQRVWALVQRYRELRGIPQGIPLANARILHRTIEKVTRDVEGLKYNTAVAALMGYLNELQDREQHHEPLFRQEVETFLLLLAPFAPFIAEELWEQIGGPFSIHRQRWPVHDPALAADTVVELAVQVNGRLRDVLRVEPEMSQEAAMAAALGSPKVAATVKGRPVSKIYYLPGKLLNIVIK